MLLGIQEEEFCSVMVAFVHLLEGMNSNFAVQHEPG